MKYLQTALLILIANVFALSGFSQESVTYMEKITEESKKIQADMWDYTNAVSHGKSARKVEKRRSELLTTSQQALNRVKRMQPFEGSTTYRDSVVSFLTINYLVLKEDYAKIVDMEEIAERSYDNMEAYLMAQQAASDKMQESATMVAAEQSKFAEKHGITLITDDNDGITEKMKIASAVYDYYNVVYLIFFKSYMQELYLIEAIGKQDVSGIEQNKNALAATAKEGMGLLADVDAYNSDNSIVTTCKAMLDFYQDEAENKVADITDFYLKNENFASVQSSFEQIKEKNRTQEDVDRYNKAVNDLNAAVEKFNETNEMLNKERSTLLDNWNKSVAKFTDKHVPSGK